MATEQQFCLKWNNHRSTLFSVFDTLLEEESLVDVTLSAEGQFLRAHRVILSACSPYFRNMFKSQFLNDKHPVVIMKDVEFENLKSLVEYMYKGEANVPQHMLSAFIKDAESLQIRGLAECANKTIETEQLLSNSSSRGPSSHRDDRGAAGGDHRGHGGPVHHSTPINSKKSNKQHPPSPASSAASALSRAGPGGILAQQLMAKMNDHPMSSAMFLDNFSPENFPASLLRNPGLGLPGLGTPPGFPGGPPHMKKPRKSTEPRPRSGGSPTKEATNGKKHPKLANKPLVPTNNNYDDEDSDRLKIDEDADPGKENLESKMEDDIAEVDGPSNGVSEEEEEPSMPGPAGGLDVEAASEIINPWTGGKLSISEENDENSAQEGADGQMVFPSPLMEQIAGSLNNGRGSAGSRGGLNTSGDPANPDGTGPSKYGCARCGRSYQHQATLVRHQRYECGIQASYPCEYCNRKFKRRDVLKGHKEKCVNKVQAQAALASLNASGVITPSGMVGGSASGTTTPTGAVSPHASMSMGAVSPPTMVMDSDGAPPPLPPPPGIIPSGFHHTF